MLLHEFKSAARGKYSFLLPYAIIVACVPATFAGIVIAPYAIASISFAATFVLTLELLQAVDDVSPECLVQIVICVVAGCVGAAVGVFLLKRAFFFVGAALGVVVAHQAFSLIPSGVKLPTWGVSIWGQPIIPYWGLLLISSVVLGIAATKYKKQLLTLSTAALGSAGMVLGARMSAAANDVLLPSWTQALCFVIATGLGIISQRKLQARKIKRVRIRDTGQAG